MDDWYRRPMEATLAEGYVSAPSADRGSGLPPIEASWLGRVPYRRAWELQKRLVAARAAGRIGDQLLLLEHPAVLTLGRGADERHVRASPDDLTARGIDVLRVERGGEVTYHGPGQLVAYPIIALAERGLLLRPFVRSLEAALAGTCRGLGVAAGRRDGHPGCWCEPDGPSPRKIGALGLRVERGVSYHGIALNVAVDLADFGLIDACGMPDVVSTSIAHELGGGETASTASVSEAAQVFAAALATALNAPLVAPPRGGPSAEAGSAERAMERLDRLASG
jgi:lipoyl(octanoyl) transferase